MLENFITVLILFIGILLALLYIINNMELVLRLLQ